MSAGAPRITGLTATAVDLPMPPHRTAGGVVSSFPMVLVDLATDAGVTGRSYLFTYTRLALAPTAQLLGNMASIVRGEPLAPRDLFATLDRRFRLLGVQGLTGMAISGIDMAAWDALARLNGLPLVRALGGSVRSLPVYLSLGMDGPEGSPAEAAKAVTRGFRAIKVKIGYETVADDLAVIRAIRREVGEGIALMVDYNQSLGIAEARKRLAVHDAEGLAWVEEPTRWEDFAGNADIAAAAATPIQLGENWWWPDDAAKALAARAGDYAMLDIMKIGGVTGWQRAAALAAAHGVPVCTHLFPEFSSHVMAVTPGAFLMEYQDWADPVLAEPYVVKDGMIAIPDRPGAGLEWNADAVQRHRVA